MAWSLRTALHIFANGWKEKKIKGGSDAARSGPFVMNTQAEIRQAIEDYRQGRMGATNS
ncbi:MAG: pirin-like C-terminal cupin domain-containing protein [Acidobacteriota bacterium]